MSLASASYQVIYVSDGVTYTVFLQGAQGDIYQRYSGPASAPSSVEPAWTGITTVADKPLLKVVLMSSDPDDTAAALADKVNDSATKWFANDDELTFDNAGICNSGDWAGVFRRVKASDNDPEAPFGGLRMNKDIVAASGGVPVNIRVQLAINHVNKVSHGGAAYAIRVLPILGEGALADIYCDASQSMTLSSANTSVTLKARCWRGGAMLADSAFSRKWYLMVAGQWVLKSSADSYTVSRDDINTFGEVKVECYSKDSGQLIAADTQTVADVSDPYVIHPNPNPADGRIYQNPALNGSVTLTPILKRTSGETLSGTLFLFAVLDPAGTIQNTDNTVPKSSYTVTRAMAENMNASPLVNITAVQPA